MASSFETHRFAMLLRMRSQTLMVRSASRRQVYVACVNLATMRVSNHEATEEAAMIQANRKML
jgi:hypothetical protein